MDLTYLFALQNLRNGCLAFLTTPMLIATAVAESFFILSLTALVYWCCDKRLGRLILMNFSFSYAFATMLKNSFCIYRPWMRAPELIPANNAIETATGYSFPSRHTVRMATFAMPVIAKKHKTDKLLCTFLILMMITVAFSRNFLGVHTPQDVIAGLLLSAFVTYICIKIDNWLEENPDADKQFLFIAAVIFIILTAIFVLKPYPVDYRAGKIIYSPLKPKYESFSIAGYTIGFLVGWYIERRFINFEIPKNMRYRIFAGIFGLLAFIVVRFLFSLLHPFLHKAVWNFVKGFYPLIFILVIWPAVIKPLYGKDKNKTC